MNYTPIQELEYILNSALKCKEDKQEAAIAFTEYFITNKDVLLYNEKYIIIDAFDLGNDPFRMHRNIPEKQKTPGQEFFENNFINL